MDARPAINRPAGDGAVETDPKRRPKSTDLRPLRRLMPLVLQYRGRVLLALISLLMAAFATLVVPLAVRRVIDNGFSDANAGFVDQYFAMMLVVVAMLALASAARFYFVTWIGERVVADLRDAVFGKLMALSPAFFETMRSGEVMSRLTADTTQIKSVFGSSASVALRNLVMLIGSVAMMVVTSPKLSGLTLLALPLIVLPLVLFGRKVRALSRRAQDTLADSAALAQETLSAVPTVQAFGQQSRVWQRFSNATHEAFDAARLRTRARALLTAAIIFISFGSVVAVLWYGAQDVLAGRMTGGTLGQFLLYAAFAAGAMGSLSEVWGELQLAAGAAERLSELLDTEPQITAPARPAEMPQPPAGTVEFADVGFCYPLRPDQPALSGVNFAIGSGETVAIVGPSGAGKTSIFNLILRFYDASDGKVCIDGIDVRNADPLRLRERIAVVPQDTVVFSGTIADNIRFGRPEASSDEVMAAARAARVDEFAERLEAGYESMVGERGVTLSGGQRQRLAIARAILADAPILLLDEATSALDAESETLVQEALQQLISNRTTLVIAHRLATVRNADRIIVLDGGRVVAEGSHTALMKKDGLYARLAKLQFTDGELH
ncbi:MAG: ABC transporter transmembrane domain-containing protein [Aestuariivirgaceae bacterium]